MRLLRCLEMVRTPARDAAAGIVKVSYASSSSGIGINSDTVEYSVLSPSARLRPREASPGAQRRPRAQRRSRGPSEPRRPSRARTRLCV